MYLYLCFRSYHQFCSGSHPGQNRQTPWRLLNHLSSRREFIVWGEPFSTLLRSEFIVTTRGISSLGAMRTSPQSPLHLHRIGLLHLLLQLLLAAKPCHGSVISPIYLQTYGEIVSLLLLVYCTAEAPHTYQCVSEIQIESLRPAGRRNSFSSSARSGPSAVESASIRSD